MNNFLIIQNLMEMVITLKMISGEVVIVTFCSPLIVPLVFYKYHEMYVVYEYMHIHMVPHGCSNKNNNKKRNLNFPYN